MSRIFLSHSSRDNAKALGVRDWLVREGWDDLFLDLDPERGITGGERWERALNEAAYRCEAVLFLVSPAWLKSEWCLKEFHLAQKLNKQVFGVVIDGKVKPESLPLEVRKTWQLVNLAQGQDHELFRVVLPDGEEKHVSFSGAGLTKLRSGMTKAGLDPRFFAWPPPNDPDRAPYRGMRPMEAEDAGIFYGREAPTIEALDRLRGLREAAPPRLFVILGASGAGKSSFLRAGLWPRLTRDDRTFLPLPVIRPQHAVLNGETGLVVALQEITKAKGLKRTRSELRAAVSGGEVPVAAVLEEFALEAQGPRLRGEAESAPPTLVLAIDQAEELFLSEGRAEAHQLLCLLARLLARASPKLIVLFTIRSDAYERLQIAEELSGVKQVTFSLPPLPKGAYQTVIEGPAQRLKDSKRKLTAEPALTQQLLQDIEAGGAKDALPLLAFTLERLYLEHGGDGDLRLSEYQAIGGIRGSIDAAVQQAHKTADGDPAVPRDTKAREALLRRALIPWLAGIDPDTNAPRRRVARLSEIPEETRPLVQHLIDQRLLATDVDANNERTIEPAHEALLRQWGLLQGWLLEDAAALSAVESVRRAARDWGANFKDSAWLSHQAGRLEDAARLTTRDDFARYFETTDREYLQACREAEDNETRRKLREARRIRAWSVAATLLAAAAIGLAWYGFDRAKLANEQRTSALRNESAALTALSSVELKNGQPAKALKLALAAWPRSNADDRPQFESNIDAVGAALAQHFARPILAGHEGTIIYVVWSPDGTRLATASRDNTARLWNAATGQVIAVLKGHENWVTHIAWSPDGTRLATASRDKTARLWDAATGQEIAVLKGHEDIVNYIAWSPDGTRLATASKDKTARLWDAANGHEIAVLKGHESVVWRIAWSPDGTRLATASADNTARLWDAATGQEIAVLKGHDDIVTYIAWSPDGTQLATASADNTARLWDAATGHEIAVLKGHENWLTHIAWSPDGTRLATASRDKTARLWDAATGQVIAVLKGHGDIVTHIAWSPDGTRLATASRDKTARLWDAATGHEIAVLKGHEDIVTYIAWSPDGTQLATASADNTARLWNAATGQERVVLKGHENWVTHIAWSPDGTRLATASRDKTARLWNAATGQEIAVLKGHEDIVTYIAWSPDGTRLATASKDKTARLWDAANGHEIAVLKGHESVVWRIAWSPDGTRLATASADDTARLWDAATGQEIAVLKGHDDIVIHIAWSPDGTRLATASADNTARLWDAATGHEIAVLKGHGDIVTHIAWSPDGTRLATASRDKTARLWDAATGQVIAVLKGHESSVSHIAWSPDGTRLATASRDKTARLWDAATGHEIAVLKGHENWLTYIAWSPDGTQLATASADNTARLWDAASGQVIAVLKGHEDIVTQIAWSPDGTRLATASSDGTSRVWDATAIPKGSLFDIACARLFDRRLSGLANDIQIIDPICSEPPASPDPSRIIKLQRAEETQQ